MQITITPFRTFLRTVPDTVHTHMICRIANHLLSNQLIAKRLQVLDGKRIRLTVTDCSCSLCFKIRNGYLQSETKDIDAADVHIRGKLVHFLLLATRNEDPDTLFFARDLCMEGNTEDGLYVKNLLDALDFDTGLHLKSILGNSLASYLTPHIQRLGIGKHLQSLGKHLRVV